MTSSFASLPIELVLSVLSVAAVHRPTALVLSLVSSWVRRHVEPSLYHTVYLCSARSLAAFIATLHGKPHGFAHQAVKKLCIMALGPISSIQTVLAECTGIASLACGFSVPSYVYCVRGRRPGLGEQGFGGTTIGYPSLPATPKEQYLLSLACRDGLDMAIMSPTVTHLRIQLTGLVTSESVARLAELKHLTHLALVYSHRLFGLDVIKDMLRPVIQGGSLRVLILQVADGVADANFESIRRWGRAIDDTKLSNDVTAVDRTGSQNLIVSVSKAPRSFLSEWEEGDAFWQCAESFESEAA